MTNPFLAEWGSRTYVMGVVNVTPDSFSGDGIVGGAEEAARWAHACQAAGADVIDIGGESTRPGYNPVPVDEEVARVIPAIEAAAPVVRVPISVDTTKVEVARRALHAGATIVNDVSGATDGTMLRLVAEWGSGLVLVHQGRGRSGEDVLQVVRQGLEQAVDRACSWGVDLESIVIDPGLGFGKTWRENFEILRRLSELESLRRPILVGPSRKGMIGKVLGVDVADRVEGSLALVTISVAGGADMIRVHDVQAMTRAARMTDALTR